MSSVTRHAVINRRTKLKATAWWPCSFGKYWLPPQDTLRNSLVMQPEGLMLRLSESS